MTSQTDSIRFVISNDADNLREELQKHNTFSVIEAEYGGVEVEGSTDALTLNHHVRPGRPCPCAIDNAAFDGVRDEIEVVGISHFDLDTLGGAMALLGIKPDATRFWTVAAFVDTNGAHRIKECSEYDLETHLLLASFWAWSNENRLFSPRDGSIDDVTEFVMKAAEELAQILSHEEERMLRGRNFFADEEDLKERSFLYSGTSQSGLNIVVRSADQFVNTLYFMGDGSPADIVIGYSTKFKSVTISRANDSVALMARDFVQELWGKLAGGHPGIAGSPREQEMSFEDAKSAFEALMAR